MPNGKKQNHSTEAEIVAQAVMGFIRPLVHHLLAEVEQQNAPQGPAVLRAKDAAEYLATSPSTLGRLVDRGDIKPIMVKDERRYTRRELDRYIRRQEG
jgi:excisionase family DNA binding protein